MNLNTGQLVAQCGHAFVDAFVEATQKRPDTIDEYKANAIKVALRADDISKLMDAEAAATAAGLPCARITEQDGTITAIGIGPARRSECNKITRGFKLLP